LDPIEKAIRNAFEKGNAEDRAFREKVYRSAFAALDRVLQANPNVTVEAAIGRRKAVQAKITEIESEFLPAVPDVTLPPENIAPAGNRAPDPRLEAPAVSAAPSVDAPLPPSQTASSPSITVDGPVQPDASDQPRSRVLPRVPDIMPDETALPDAPSLDDSPGAPVGNGAQVAPDRDERRIRGRRLPLTAIFVVATLVAALGIGGYFAIQTGVFKTAAQLDTGPPEPTPTLDSEDSSQQADTGSPRKPGEADQSKNWISIFSPADPTHVSTPSDAGADVMKDDTGQFLRIRSGTSGSAIAFDVGQGVLEKLAGKHAMFDIVARSEEGKETQISVDCNFGDLGDCGRKRYAVGHERNEYLFDVQFPDKQPGAAGTIAVNSDIDQKGKSVDIYEIRVSIAQ
jgi:hypothetical protein